MGFIVVPFRPLGVSFDSLSDDEVAACRGLRIGEMSAWTSSALKLFLIYSGKYYRQYRLQRLYALPKFFYRFCQQLDLSVIFNSHLVVLLR